MPNEVREATELLKRLYRQLPGADAREILTARDEVLPRYQRIFGDKHLSKLSESEFRGFLSFRNNRHWKSLDRLGTAICHDMPRLRRALKILLNERRPIGERLSTLRPPLRQPYVLGLSQAVLTPILMIRYPKKYGVWNKVTEVAFKTLSIPPHLAPSDAFANRYERINSTLLQIAAEIGVDLWTLDALWWRIGGAQGSKRRPHRRRRLWKNARLVSGQRQLAGRVVAEFTSRGDRFVVFRRR